jgi:uncharacterized membrane protein
MPTLPLHPFIVHIPLGLAFVIPLVAAALFVAHRRGRLPRSAFAVLVGLQVVMLAAGGAALWAGERDAKRVERVVPEGLIDAHEERAETFLVAAGVVLAGSVALLAVPAGAVTAIAGAVLAGTLAVAALAAWTGKAGGELVYRHGAASAFLPANVPAPAGAPASAAYHAGGDD